VRKKKKKKDVALFADKLLFFPPYNNNNNNKYSRTIEDGRFDCIGEVVNRLHSQLFRADEAPDGGSLHYPAIIISSESSF
jgi:hypothetical protein